MATMGDATDADAAPAPRETDVHSVLAVAPVAMIARYAEEFRNGGYATLVAQRLSDGALGAGASPAVRTAVAAALAAPSASARYGDVGFPASCRRTGL